MSKRRKGADSPEAGARRAKARARRGVPDAPAVVHPATGATVPVVQADAGAFEQALPEILGRLANGEHLTEILPGENRPAHLPSRGYFHERVAANNPKGLADAYTRAREAWAFSQAEVALHIADDSEHDTKRIVKRGVTIELPDKEWIGRSRLRVETRKWLIARFNRTVFGEGNERGEADEKAIPYPVVALPELDPPHGVKAASA